MAVQLSVFICYWLRLANDSIKLDQSARLYIYPLILWRTSRIESTLGWRRLKVLKERFTVLLESDMDFIFGRHCRGFFVLFIGNRFDGGYGGTVGTGLFCWFVF